MLSKLYVSILLACTLVFFQNCGSKVQFSDKASSDNTKLATVDINTDEPVVVDTGDGGGSGDDVGGSIDQDGGSDDVASNDDGHDDDGDHDGDHHGYNHGDDDNHDGDSHGDIHSGGGESCGGGDDNKYGGDHHSNLASKNESEDDELVACILEGNGKSVKLGIVSDSLDGVNAVSQSVCVSRKACLELVPEKFNVKGADDR
jgi:hypothetical protein